MKTLKKAVLDHRNGCFLAGCIITGVLLALILLGAVWTPYDPTAMVPCGAGDDAALPLLRGQRADFIVRAPQLERTGKLKIFRLNVYVFPQLFRGIQRRHPGYALQRGLSIQNHFQSQHDVSLLYDYLGTNDGHGKYRRASSVLRARKTGPVRNSPKVKYVLDAGTKLRSFVLYVIIRLLEQNQSFNLRLAHDTKSHSG